MKNFHLLTALLTALLFFSACNKEKVERTIVDKTIRNAEIFVHTVGAFGDEEGATVSRQASHYTTSILERDLNSIITYRYQSVPGYTGTDEVEIKTSKGSDGSGPNTQIQYITIRLTITN
ncbi:MAG TPA: hypothetical protein PKA77_06715 [Chitinophagaceae bacterium]|jgi:hypothetical protein|nr:hypothetical protein [Chitinophagaceae bacterium]HMU57857.1 hypothetical protein [Chitinophagaceae bacterium]